MGLKAIHPYDTRNRGNQRNFSLHYYLPISDFEDVTEIIID